MQSGPGTYDVAVRSRDGYLSKGEQNEIFTTAKARYAVGFLLLPQGSTGLAAPGDYLGVGSFPAGEFLYALQAGHYPGPGEFALRPDTARKLGLKIGDTLTLPFRGGPQSVRLSGIRTPTGGDLGDSADGFTFDLHWLQAQMETDGGVTGLLLGDGNPWGSGYTVGALQGPFPSLLITVNDEYDGLANGLSLIGAWALSLSMVAIPGALFLVAGAFRVAINERLKEWAMLRAIGATPRQVLWMLLGEAAVLGSIGSVSGLLLGGLTATATLRLAAESFGVAAHRLTLPPLLLTAEGVLGIALSIAVTYRAAQTAQSVRPLQAMRPDRSAALRSDEAGGHTGVALLLGGALLTALTSLMPGNNFLRAIAGALGGLLLVSGIIAAQSWWLPAMVSGLAFPLRKLWPVTATMAARSVKRHGRISALTTSSFITGVMLLTAVGTFMATVTDNARQANQHRLPSDARVASIGEAPLEDRSLSAQIAAIPGVSAVAGVGHRILGGMAFYDFSKADQQWLAEQTASGGPTAERRRPLIPVDVATLSRVVDLGTIQGYPADGITISALIARQLGLQVGDTFQYVTAEQQAQGRRGQSVTIEHFTVAAIVEKLPPSIPEGFLVPRTLFDGPDDEILIQYDPTRHQEATAAVQQLLRERQVGLVQYEDRLTYEENLLRETRQIQVILGAVALTIFLTAGMSLVNMIAAGLRERRHELATMRAIGATPRQMVAGTVLESVLIALAGSIQGLVAGALFLTAALIGLADGGIHYFPWTLYAGLVLGSVALAALAALGPAISAFRGSVMTALKSE